MIYIIYMIHIYTWYTHIYMYICYIYMYMCILTVWLTDWLMGWGFWLVIHSVGDIKYLLVVLQIHQFTPYTSIKDHHVRDGTYKTHVELIHRAIKSTLLEWLFEGIMLPGLLGIIITISRESIQPSSRMRWNNGIFNDSISLSCKGPQGDTLW